MVGTQRLTLGLMVMGLGVVCYAWGAEPPRKETPEPTVAQLLERISQLEKRISRLEKERIAYVPATQPPNAVEPAQHEEEDWRSRALGSRVVNGNRVYFLPLTQRKD